MNTWSDNLFSFNAILQFSVQVLFSMLNLIFTVKTLLSLFRPCKHLLLKLMLCHRKFESYSIHTMLKSQNIAVLLFSINKYVWCVESLQTYGMKDVISVLNPLFHTWKLPWNMYSTTLKGLAEAWCDIYVKYRLYIHNVWLWKQSFNVTYMCIDCIFSKVTCNLSYKKQLTVQKHQSEACTHTVISPTCCFCWACSSKQAEFHLCTFLFWNSNACLAPYIRANGAEQEMQKVEAAKSRWQWSLNREWKQRKITAQS